MDVRIQEVDRMANANIKVTFLCPVEKVWDIVTNLSNYEWRSDVSKIEIVDDRKFIEYTPDGFKTEFVTTDKELYKIWEFDLENESIKGHWSGKFYAQEDRTTLDFTENATAKKLLMKPIVGAYLKKQQKQYFMDLKKALQCEEASKIQVL